VRPIHLLNIFEARIFSYIYPDREVAVIEVCYLRVHSASRLKIHASAQIHQILLPESFENVISRSWRVELDACHSHSREFQLHMIFKFSAMVPAPASDRLRIRPQLALTFVLSFVALPKQWERTKR
jgi:hypothetical protein